MECIDFLDLQTIEAGNVKGSVAAISLLVKEAPYLSLVLGFIRQKRRHIVRLGI